MKENLVYHARGCYENWAAGLCIFTWQLTSKINRGDLLTKVFRPDRSCSRARTHIFLKDMQKESDANKSVRGNFLLSWCDVVLFALSLPSWSNRSHTQAESPIHAKKFCVWNGTRLGSATNSTLGGIMFAKPWPAFTNSI